MGEAEEERRDEDEVEEENTEPAIRYGRVVMTNDLHDERTDKDRFAVSRGAPVRLQSVWNHLNKVCCGVTGFLSFGKPGVLVFEGAVPDVEKMVEETKRLPGWFYATEKWLDKEDGIQDVESWRLFTDFNKVRIEDVKELFDEKLKRLDVYEEILPEPKKRFSRAKQKL